MYLCKSNTVFAVELTCYHVKVLGDSGLLGFGGCLRPGSLLNFAGVPVGQRLKSLQDSSPWVRFSDSLVNIKRETPKDPIPVPVPVINPRVATKGNSCVVHCALT